jgi:hypothetical protein
MQPQTPLNIALITIIALFSVQLPAQTLVLSDPLSGSTLGTKAGGSFAAGGGWQVTGHTNSIYWHIPTLSHGAVEWDMRGLNVNEGRAGMQDKAELFHMYDYSFGNADVNYNGGYRDDPYKHFIRKIGTLGGATNALELVWQILPNYVEPDTAQLSWNAASTYHFREEWAPDGAGNSVLKTYRDGQLLRTSSVPGVWNPSGHSVRIAASPRAAIAADAGAPVDAVYSNLKIWNLAVNEPPPPLPARRTGRVSLNNHVLKDDGGEFLGLGASYFQALRRTKYDRARYRSDLDFLARRGFTYIRTLSMVGWYPAWDGKEIAPITFQDQQGNTIPAWNDYWQQLRDMVDIAYDDYGLRTELTIFADAQLMPNKADRIAHMQQVLNNLQGRENKIILLEVANEAWQNGFPDAQGVADLREFGAYLGNRTDVLVALSATPDPTNASLENMYAGSAADIATEHFHRDVGTIEGSWLQVREPYRVNSAVGVPPASHNEPIGPGSSVASETSPIKLVSAAAYAWMSGLPMYVYHTSAGVFGDVRFEDMAGVSSYQYLAKILPGDIANWQRTEGDAAFAPFITHCNGQPNVPWTSVPGATNGLLRHLSNVRGKDFYTLPIAIRANGVELEPRQNMTMQAFNPATGEVMHERTPTAGVRFTLPQGPEAYIIRGHYATPGQKSVSTNLDRVNTPDGITHPHTGDGDTVSFTIGGRNARRNDNPAEDFYMYFAAADWFTSQASDPTLYIAIEYFDDGNGPLTLQYDSNTGNTLPAFFKNGGSVQRTDSDTWKTHLFRVTDSFFGNRQNYGADFRIGAGVGNTFYLDGVTVFDSLMAGDADLDGDVDLSDLGTLASNFGSNGRNWVHGDFDFDGDVDLADLGSVASNYEAGRSQALADFQSMVPEPAAASLAATAALLAARRPARGSQ